MRSTMKISYDDEGEPTHKIGVIQANPEQSKHLETATFSIGNIEVDINSLRTEVYAENSRIPMIVISTHMTPPLQPVSIIVGGRHCL